MRSFRRSVMMIAALVVALASAAASAQVLGPVTIKGKLYINGALINVNCAGADGNTLDGTDYGVRIFHIDPSCLLYEDTGGGEFRFLGQEDQIFVNDHAKNILVFSGTEQGTGPALGAAHSQQKVKDTGETLLVTSEKGQMNYSYLDGSENSIIFVGTFKATY
jgi:hypothetical protein